MNDAEKQINLFLGKMFDDADLRPSLWSVFWNRDDLVALGKEHGYEFTRGDLDAFMRKGSLLAVAGAALLALGVGAVS